MINQKLITLVAGSCEADLRKALSFLFMPHANPVFGASKAVEHEVAAINALKLLGYLSSYPDEFELVEKLRVTKSKARALLYQTALREASDPLVAEQELRAILMNPLIAVDGDIYLIEAPQPLTMDRLRQRVRQLGYLSDGSFSGSVARIKRQALAALIESLIPKENQTEVINKLTAKGYQGSDVRALVTGVLKKAGAKVAGEVGDELAGKLGKSIAAVFERTWDGVFDA